MRMMEVVNNYTATVYYRGNMDESGNLIRSSTIVNNDISKITPDDGQLVKWKVEYRIKRFPRMLAS